jgi:uncharacterized protein YcfL
MNNKGNLRGEIHMKIITIYAFIVLAMLMLIGCGTKSNPVTKENDEEKVEKIEAFVANTLPYEEGDYKLVNSQTIMYGSGENLKVEARIVEDFFDKDGKYIKTRLRYSSTEKGGEDEVVFVDEPMTILLNNQHPQSSLTVKDLNDQEKEDVKDSILKIFKTEF